MYSHLLTGRCTGLQWLPTNNVPPNCMRCSKCPTLSSPTQAPHTSALGFAHTAALPGRSRLLLPQYLPTRDSPASCAPCGPAHSRSPAPRTVHAHTPSPGSPLTPSPDSLPIKIKTGSKTQPRCLSPFHYNGSCHSWVTPMGQDPC